MLTLADGAAFDRAVEGSSEAWAVAALHMKKSDKQATNWVRKL